MHHFEVIWYTIIVLDNKYSNSNSLFFPKVFIQNLPIFHIFHSGNFDYLIDTKRKFLFFPSISQCLLHTYKNTTIFPLVVFFVSKIKKRKMSNHHFLFSSNIASKIIAILYIYTRIKLHISTKSKKNLDNSMSLFLFPLFNTQINIVKKCNYLISMLRIFYTTIIFALHLTQMISD